VKPTPQAPGTHKSLAMRYRAYWAEFSLPLATLHALRAAFFGLVSLDAVLRLDNAPRYGAGDFNVPNLPIWHLLPLPDPTRPIVTVLLLMQAYLALRVACIASARWSLATLTGLYGYYYFGSQLDSFQHHYLVFLLLVVCNFVPWTGPANSADPPAPSDATATVTSWAVRLLMVQIALLYGWAAVAKLDPLWLDGRTLNGILQNNDGTVASVTTVIELLGPATCSVLVVIVEAVLAIAWTVRARWMRIPALIAGIGLHVGIEFSGIDFEIGIFSYFMVTLYLLWIPDRVVCRIAEQLSRIPWPRPRVATPTMVAIMAGASIAGATLLHGIRLPHTIWAIAGITAVYCIGQLPVIRRIALGAAPIPPLRAAVVHIAGCAAIVALCARTDVAHNYYKFWAGTARRLGSHEEAKQVYLALTEISPEHGSGHYHLGELLAQEGHWDQALASYRRAQQYSPSDPRPLLGEAIVHDHAGRGAQVIEAIDRLLTLSPNHRIKAQAMKLRRRWQP